MSVRMMEIQPCRVTENRPCALRWFARKDGTKILQAAYLYTEGDFHGVTWEDIPVVYETEQDNGN